MNKKLPTSPFYYSTVGLPNALLFTDRLQQALIFAKRYAMWLAVLTVELTPLAKIEQELGTKVKDDIELLIANRLNESIYQQDTLAQIDNKKFIIMLTCLLRDDHYSMALQRIVKALTEPVNINGKMLQVHFNIGIALYPKHGDSAESLINHAELALAYAKKNGVDNFKMYQAEIDYNNMDLHLLQDELIQALQRDEFILEYQPIYDIKTQSIVGVETLLRWLHPKYGLINPRTFIPLADKANLIIPLSEWILRTACNQCKLWRESGLPPIQMIINLLGQHIKTDSFKDTLIQIVKETRMLPDQLELEISENNLADNTKDLVKLMLDLQKIGVRIALNDFDIRFSNIDFLMQFPIYKIKIDQTYIENITKNTKDAEIICAAIATAHQLKLRVLAVGVETKEQFEFLRANKVDEIQGYYFSKPINAKNFARLLQDNIVLYVKE